MVQDDDRQRVGSQAQEHQRNQQQQQHRQQQQLGRSVQNQASSHSQHNRNELNARKFEPPTVDVQLTQQQCNGRSNDDDTNHGPRQFVIGGFTGSGTRLPMRVLQSAGVFFGPEHLISSDGDTLAWIRSMANKRIHDQITKILSFTGSTDYSVADVRRNAQLVRDVDEEFEVG